VFNNPLALVDPLGLEPPGWVPPGNRPGPGAPGGPGAPLPAVPGALPPDLPQGSAQAAAAVPGLLSYYLHWLQMTGWLEPPPGPFQITRIRMEHFADNYPLMRPFIDRSGPQKYLFVLLLLIGPIFEEAIMRGFLYRAFRKTYGITLSVSIIVLAAMLTHPGVMKASPWLFLFLGVVQAVLCLILEKTGNLWNCIACHFAYNATVVCAWLMGTSVGRTD